MSLRINIRDFVNRIQKRYSATTKIDNQQPSLSEQVIPITNADETLKTLVSDQKEYAHAGAGAGWISTYVVPKGEKWTVHFIGAFVTSGTGTVQTLGVVKAGKTYRNELQSFTPATSVRYDGTMKDFILEEYDRVDWYMNASTVAGNLTVQILYTKEDKY